MAPTRSIDLFLFCVLDWNQYGNRCFSSSDEIPAEPEGEAASCSIAQTVGRCGSTHRLLHDEHVFCLNLLMDCSPTQTALSTEHWRRGHRTVSVVSNLNNFTTSLRFCRQNEQTEKQFIQNSVSTDTSTFAVVITRLRRGRSARTRQGCAARWRTANRWGCDAAAVSLFYRHKRTMKHLFRLDKCHLVMSKLLFFCCL